MAIDTSPATYWTPAVRTAVVAEAADGQSADGSGSLQLPLLFLKAGLAGGRLWRPSSAGSTARHRRYRTAAGPSPCIGRDVRLACEHHAPNENLQSAVLGGEDVQDKTIIPSPAALDTALRHLNGDTTTTLLLEHHGRRLYVGGGPHRFNVLAQLGYDDFYDLIGDPSLRGWDFVVLGDQLTPIPKRHLTSGRGCLRRPSSAGNTTLGLPASQPPKPPQPLHEPGRWLDAASADIEPPDRHDQQRRRHQRHDHHGAGTMALDHTNEPADSPR
jgi:hypothetical protein